MLITRRALIVGGVAAGLVVAWRRWPDAGVVQLPLADGETGFGGWIKIGTDGHVVVAVPALEYGQGAYTALPQIVADEMGADWRTVGVEAAVPNALYANPLAAAALWGEADAVTRAIAPGAPMLTGGASSVRHFEEPMRRAAAVTRVLLCKAAVRRWGGDWAACTAADGLVTLGGNRARFGELAADAAAETASGDEAAFRTGGDRRLAGTVVPRLDAPAKVDGSVNFAADVRLPGMVFASIRQGPVGGTLAGVDRAAAEAVPGMLRVVENPGWVAAIGSNWWAANRGLAALSPRFARPEPALDDAAIARALMAALGQPGQPLAAVGDVANILAAGTLTRADYRTGLSLPAAIEPVAATATWDAGRLIVWAATQAPGLARAAAARITGLAEDDVVLHPLMAGGSFGANLEVRAIEQAALLAKLLERPVQLSWSRAESLIQTPPAAPALIRMTARAIGGGAILGWRAQLAAVPIGAALRARQTGRRALLEGAGDRPAGEGATTPYRLPAVAIDHHVATLPMKTGRLPGGAAIANVFATESFVDELARAGGAEPLSYRIGMLGGAPRLARCLSTVASLGGWQGGVAGSGQGIACAALWGSHIALMVEGGLGDGGVPRVERMVAAVDVGRVINPDLVRQVIEGGLIQGLAGATGASASLVSGLLDVRGFRDLALPRLATTPDITVELIESDAAPGGASELAQPVVAPALANAIVAATGRRLRSLPL
ncbi:isoquinoline 1-oxidoreductase, beta subunit [Sphingomonas guangdongensis]|uniref:Isoquinoline 1-oxidoreductase, beta subunit n=1 Tax=Sphingomonas guangdongensis TaxID=1141890 RepID=A0A285QGP3_9SPHN|nr:molybdopterin cofactor-binding domain-containing protein [Sphingomonas guangdongensis]SOB81016.1 isoquinoline 1-oxidoreductase, beta subunit [Sphingomonas guangdongensis]